MQNQAVNFEAASEFAKCVKDKRLDSRSSASLTDGQRVRIKSIDYVNNRIIVDCVAHGKVTAENVSMDIDRFAR